MSTIASVKSIFVFPTAASAEQEAIRQENLAIATGLKHQEAGLLDQLIVRYQHRLLRYLLYLTGSRELAVSSTARHALTPGCSPSRATW
jgi:RNA polymerase sigma-70 factor (ECF subfamily)